MQRTHGGLTMSKPRGVVLPARDERLCACVPLAHSRGAVGVLQAGVKAVHDVVEKDLTEQVNAPSPPS